VATTLDPSTRKWVLLKKDTLPGWQSDESVKMSIFHAEDDKEVAKVHVSGQSKMVFVSSAEVLSLS